MSHAVTRGANLHQDPTDPSLNYFPPIKIHDICEDLRSSGPWYLHRSHCVQLPNNIHELFFEKSVETLKIAVLNVKESENNILDPPVDPDPHQN